MQQGTNWGGDYSRFSFDEMKRYVSMLKEQGKVVLDDEFNLAQEILHTLGRRLVQDGFGDGAVGDGWKIVGTGASNDFTITGGDGTAAGAGHVYVNGILVVLPSNITYSTQEIAGPALTTPAGARTDEVYLDVWLDEYGPADDGAIIDPSFGSETSRRLRVQYMVRVAEGGITPADYIDAGGITHYTRLLARINRTATAAINGAMVVDARPKFTWDRANIDYVLSQASIVPARTDATQLYNALVVLVATLVPPVPVATTEVQGKVELATGAETQAGTDATRAVTPAGLFAAAVPAPTANRVVRRDAAGRAQMAAPAAANDIAIKSNVDAVQASVDNHATATTGVHGVGGSTVESAAGAQAKVDAHAALTNPHGATPNATANRMILRDAGGRASIVGPIEDDNIATKFYVDTAVAGAGGVSGDLSAHIAKTGTAVHGLGTASTQNMGNYGHNVPFLDGTNTWSGLNEFSKDGSAIELRLLRNDSSMSAGSRVSILQSKARNSSGYAINWAAMYAAVTSATAGSEKGYIAFHTIQPGGNYDQRVGIGAGLYVGLPSGGTSGDMGFGTINATAVYDDGVQLTCYAIEAYKKGSVDIAYWDDKVLDVEVPEEPEQVEERQVTRKVKRARHVREGDALLLREVEEDEPVLEDTPVVDSDGNPVLDESGDPVIRQVPKTERVVVSPAKKARKEVRLHERARRFAERADELLDPERYAAFWKTHGYLPAMPSPDEWEAANKKMGLGDILQRVWETVETQAIHIEKLREEIASLKAPKTPKQV